MMVSTAILGVTMKTDMTITLNGLGAYFALAKAITGGELSNEGTEVPEFKNL